MTLCFVTGCEGDTYGIGCRNCSDNCRNRKCKKYSETLICKQGCVAGKTGSDCSMGKNNDCVYKTVVNTCNRLFFIGK